MYRLRLMLVRFYAFRCTGFERFWFHFLNWDVRGTSNSGAILWSEMYGAGMSGSGLILWSEMYGERAVLVWFYDLRCTGNQRFWFDFMIWDVRGTSNSGAVVCFDMHGLRSVLARSYSFRCTGTTNSVHCCVLMFFRIFVSLIGVQLSLIHISEPTRRA